jgi:carbon storage regulator
MEDIRMLVLTRKIGERILIGDDITITVVEAGRSRVKLGIEAPAGHRILRSELLPGAESTGSGPEAGAGTMRTKVDSARRPLRQRSAGSAAGVGV